MAFDVLAVYSFLLAFAKPLSDGPRFEITGDLGCI